MKKKTAADFGLPGWDRLRHSGLLFDAKRAAELRKSFRPPRLLDFREARLRTLGDRVLDAGADAPRAPGTSDFVTFVLTKVCGFSADTGKWQRGSSVPKCQGRQALTGRVVKPRQLWNGRNGARLPVFFGEDPRLGIGRSRRFVSEVVEWLRAGDDRLALLTNGRQWRLLFAGLDYEASCEWDLDSWFEEGGLAPQVETLRTLLSPELWTPEAKGTDPPLLRAIRDTRKGQAEISEVLGEQVREAVERLIRGHGQALSAQGDSLVPADIYRAACRVAMRLVVILYAEARELLPRGNARYDAAYGLGSLHELLERSKAAGRGITESRAAWPRALSLFSLVHDGSAHPDLPVKDYGGDLFAPGSADADDGVSRALFVFENACFDQESHFYDADVHEMLASLTRTEIVLPQGGCVSAPVDFSDLSSEYIGVLYEGLLDYELKTAPADDPVVFLGVGAEPALPLSRLEAMEDATLKTLFEKLKKGSAETEADEDETGEVATEDAGEPDAEPGDGADQKATEETEGEPLPPAPSDEYRIRADRWAQRAVEAAGLTPKDKLVKRVVRPGDWYLVRWGGTRKGSGSFYTRPGLAVPTTQRTLRPLAYDPPSKNGSPDRDAAPNEWTPKRPENILAITVCDPACGSGTFPLATLRFLTDALYASLHHHGRIEPDGERSLVRLLGIAANREAEKDRGGEELIPCRPDEDRFEPRLKAVLRRYVVERCIYAVDLDPLAVELCRLSLWIETMDRELPFGFLDHKIKCGDALIGAWFDQFRHYPAMAWKNRLGGDENHTNGVHFKKGTRGKTIKAFVRERLKPALQEFLLGSTVFREEDQLAKAAAAHDQAQATLHALHSLPVRDPAALAERYRREFLGSSDWQSLKEAMDRWCACWFWPVNELDFAPLPTDFTDSSTETRRISERVASEMRFFHWELEFPDVFREEGAGFSAVLGNPPWEVAKPISMEFFSNLDPLYRSYGKQAALKKQRAYFDDEDIEARWLNYQSRFRAQSNFTSHAARPFGDPHAADKPSQRFTIVRGNRGVELHDNWRKARAGSFGYCDAEHPFRQQGSADLNLYKLFLEAAHNLLRSRGRLGFLVPSGLYSDRGTRDLRDLFFERCRWEWLFSIENRRRIFPIHRNYKMNPVIVEKGSSTAVIRTAFMRHDISDWEHAEEFVISQDCDQVRRFSPNSRTLLEIRSDRDLEILGKIYDNSVLLGDDAPGGWGIRYNREFDMTGDSSLFPPRPEWEKEGYRPDEYSRWLLGNWRPIEELWEELGVDPTCPEPPLIHIEAWLLDTNTGPARQEIEARFAYGHMLRPGDVARTDGRPRCARWPYDTLPVSRTRLPPDLLLSQTGDAWIRDDEVEAVAVPLYEGRMIGQFDVSQKGWVSGKARRAVWENIPWDRKHVRPQYLMAARTDRVAGHEDKVAVMSIACSTVERTMIAAPLRAVPCNHSIGVLRLPPAHTTLLSGILNSFAYDFCMRVRLSGLNASLFVLEETPLPKPGAPAFVRVLPLLIRLSPTGLCSSLMSLATDTAALTEHERLRLRCITEATLFVTFGLDVDDAYEILRQCDLPTLRLVTARSEGLLDPKGFWRTDQDKDPELRLTVLTLVAFRDLQQRIEAAGGDRQRGIETFFSQNHGEGWLCPETLRLADYCLGHDDRALEHQPVASRLGPRFYDWQLVQTSEEREQEAHLHTRNLLGAKNYGELLASRITNGASDDGDFAPLLAGLAHHLDDDYRRRLLGETGAAALIAGLCAPEGLLRRPWPDFLNAVEAAGHLDAASRNRVFDRLRERNLLTDDEHEHYFVGGFALPHPAADLLAAEPTPKYEPRPKNRSQPKKLLE